MFSRIIRKSLCTMSSFAWTYRLVLSLIYVERYFVCEPWIFLHLSYYLPNLVPPMKILSQRLYFKYLSNTFTVGKSVLGLYGYVNWLIWLTCCQFQRKVKWKWKYFNFWLTSNAERSENLLKLNSLLVSSILENIYYVYSPVFL